MSEFNNRNWILKTLLIFYCSFFIINSLKSQSLRFIDFFVKPFLPKQSVLVPYPLENYGNNYLIIKMPSLSFFKEIKDLESELIFSDKHYKFALLSVKEYKYPIEIFRFEPWVNLKYKSGPKINSTFFKENCIYWFPLETGVNSLVIDFAPPNGGKDYFYFIEAPYYMIEKKEKLWRPDKGSRYLTKKISLKLGFDESAEMNFDPDNINNISFQKIKTPGELPQRCDQH